MRPALQLEEQVGSAAACLLFCDYMGCVCAVIEQLWSTTLQPCGMGVPLGVHCKRKQASRFNAVVRGAGRLDSWLPVFLHCLEAHLRGRCSCMVCAAARWQCNDFAKHTMPVAAHHGSGAVNRGAGQFRSCMPS